MSPSSPRSAGSRATIGALGVAAVGAAILALDNLLGFSGHHVLAAGVAPWAAVVSISTGVVAAVGTALARDGARSVLATAVVFFSTALSPALGAAAWPQFASAAQTVVPLVFAAAGLLSLHGRPRSRAERVSAWLLLGGAVAWTVSAVVPISLSIFLSIQTGTLVVAAVLALAPALRQVQKAVHGLWDSALLR